MTSQPRSDAERLTLSYYDAHTQEFCEGTHRADMAALYQPFLERLQRGAHILDAGCGSGRDAAAFVSHGYRVTAFDGSAEMVACARQLTGLPVLHMTFADVHWNAAFDAIWACASLLHLPANTLDENVGRLVRALRPSGVFYASFKQGDSSGPRGGRWFTDMTPDGARALFADRGQLEEVSVWVTSDVRPERQPLAWVNVIGRKASTADPYP